jgi:hypothetical protein|eukprot:gene1459-1547_t
MEELKSMGFEEADVAIALKKVNGNIELALELLLSGNLSRNPASDEVVIQLGISQYTFSDSGVSACTAIAASVMQFILVKLSQNNFDQICKEENLCDCIFTGVMKYNELHSSSSARNHIAVDELGAEFFQSVRGVGEIFQGLLTNSRSFDGLIEEAVSRCRRGCYIGVIVTKPPETIALIISARDHPDPRYFFFDSHSRPEQGYEGSYLVITHDTRTIIDRLNTTFPSLPGTDANNAYSYMYNMFEASFFESL